MPLLQNYGRHHWLIDRCIIWVSNWNCLPFMSIWFHIRFFGEVCLSSDLCPMFYLSLAGFVFLLTCVQCSTCLWRVCLSSDLCPMFYLSLAGFVFLLTCVQCSTCLWRGLSFFWLVSNVLPVFGWFILDWPFGFILRLFSYLTLICCLFCDPCSGRYRLK
jgi:hypothetical protein